MPHDFNSWLPKDELLTTKELITVIDIATRHGINQIRLTGGEPLLRPDIVSIVSQIKHLEFAPELSLTTNGLGLSKLAQPLFDAGLTRVNVSLDTLNRKRFHEMTFRDRFDDVIAGLEAARNAGLAPIKINAVLMQGVNDSEAVELLTWALAEGYNL